MFSNIIKKTIKFYADTDSLPNGEFNVAYGADDNFLFGTGVSIVSVLLNNKDIRFHFHIFTDLWNDKNINLFREISQMYNTNLTLYTLNINNLKGLPTNYLWSHAMYFRLIIADYFYKKCDKVLYLDSDVVCNGSIQTLKLLDLSSIPIAAVMDISESHSLEMANLFKVEGLKKGYFNSGVMLINPDEWNYRQLTEKSMSVFTDEKLQSVIKYYDQDAINIAINGDWLKLDNIFNYRINLNDRYKNRENSGISNAVFIHFIGLTKPWHDWSKYYHEVSCFLNAKEKSPWKDINLMAPKNISHHKYASKHLRYKEKYLSSFYHYLQYTILKIKGKIKM
ncbi:lipopolysaccharide 1,3-galactosyltransferase [Providencia rettgeri]|uniref:Lipopolysaccharide 1,2-glucosyltransferase n=1 Tax=Providencia rettgeri TaxID=587 RepID=A0A379FT39_PRORE|nr:glycosyltransferase [Providencia rettgeri]QXB04707.1 lipopolysaccharide 1,3-galactosyltransferase [Providencia rettgeri]SUC31929.1 Lipopolysaccharide 1,2-glucosyltransferase [Providencia rettgeri]